MICFNCGIFNALLDTMNFGIFVLNDQRKPLFANAKASGLIGEGRVFHIDGHGALRVANAAADRKLNENINALRQGHLTGKIRPISVDSDEHRSSMFAWVSILAFATADQLPSKARGMTNVTSLMVTEKAQKEIRRDVLVDLFNLTPAESRLLMSLLQGLSPNQYAAMKNRSQSTVRNQLKSIFEKTEVRRQSDLVSLVSTVLAPVNFDAASNS
jgi:DNA-binding CsgD family transcriptional regulator